MKNHYKFLFTRILCLQAGILTVCAAEKPDLDAYRKFAWTHEGNVARGKTLFNDEQRLGCAKCHSVDGTASKAGPDLFAAGDAFGRRDLVESVLAPSATISPGYGTVILKMKSGEEYQGVLKKSSDSQLTLMAADGKPITVSAADVQEKSGSSTSLMPEGLHNALSLEEFNDVIEYLTTLQQPASTMVSAKGMPPEIEELAKPIGLRPYFTNKFALPRGRWETGLTSLRQVPGFTNRFLVLHQKGIIWRVEKNAVGEEKFEFANLSSEIFSERGPNGLLDVTFHPQFKENRKYYLFYQVFDHGLVKTHIVENEFNADFTADSGKPARLLMEFTSIAEDHSGGCFLFGRDGFLYLVMGDTGPHNDPNGHAQNLGLLLGKMLRIDVDHSEDGKPYSIPGDNPFVSTPGARPEIWAYGFRNPWRFSFDRLTGELWLADVGQDRVEEVDIVHRGENYGWNVYEGFEPFSIQYKKSDRTFTMPLFAYRRKYGVSVTGGYVYRGNKTTSFYGVYICGDYNSKRIFGLIQEKGALKTVRQIGKLPQRLVSFSEDASGNIYAIGYEGTIYQLNLDETRFD